MNVSTLELSPPQREVVSHRGRHLQVVACAGSGKTEAVSRRVAALINEGASPASIVAFTFTEKAAAELKDRIVRRVAEAKGEAFKGRLAQMFVGTIHSYCFKLLQDHVPRYGNYDVLDPHRHAGLLSRESRNLGIETLGDSRHWAPIQAFTDAVDVIGNELISAKDLAGTPLGSVYEKYLDMLDRYHYLTFGLIIQKAVEALKDDGVFARVHSGLRHLIVDEYQDVNPAQEALIRRLGAPPVSVCVVGDDDQSVYQWRGSDTANILTFKERYAAHSVTLATNRRSRPSIVDAADRFASTIPQRLEKRMEHAREGHDVELVPWSAETPEDEVATIAGTVAKLRKNGFRYRDVAVLYRSVRTSAPPLIDALRERGIPVSCGGRTGLFMLPEIQTLGRAYVWQAGYEWRPAGYGQPSAPVQLDDLVAEFGAAFPAARKAREIRAYLMEWQARAADERSPANLVGDFYAMLHFFDTHQLDPDVPEQSARLGAFARFSNMLADFENVTRRARWVSGESGSEEFRGGTNRGVQYYRRLANFLQHYARDAYEDFEGEAAADVDAVQILTVHQAKGLEWPVVFLPSLSDKRFPSSMAGRARPSLLPESAFPPAARERYQGGEDEERRLFYVAMTRARDTLYLSHFRRQKNRTRPSRFLTDLFGDAIPARTTLPVPAGPGVSPPAGADKIAVSFSELASFEQCGFRFRLSTSLGFETQLVSELGYGRAIHHVLRSIAELARTTGKVPSPAEVRSLLDAEFYLPFANKGSFENMRATAERLVKRYVTKYKEDLRRVWATERPFEMHLPGGTLSGRADVILDHHEDRPDSLAVVDYKTSTDEARDRTFEFQLAVYAAAGRGEGLQIDAALLHHLDEGTRSSIDVSPRKATAAVQRAEAIMHDIQRGRYVPKPEKKKCGECEYRRLCRHAPPSKKEKNQ